MKTRDNNKLTLDYNMEKMDYDLPTMFLKISNKASKEVGLLFIMFRLPITFDDGIPEGEILMFNTDNEKLVHISDVSLKDDGITYNARFKKPISCISGEYSVDKKGGSNEDNL